VHPDFAFQHQAFKQAIGLIRTDPAEVCRFFARNSSVHINNTYSSSHTSVRKIMMISIAAAGALIDDSRIAIRMKRACLNRMVSCTDI